MPRHCIPWNDPATGTVGFICGNFAAAPDDPMPRETCPVCGVSRPLRKGGTFRQHDRYGPPDGLGPSLGQCPATGLTPKAAAEAALRLPLSPGRPR